MVQVITSHLNRWIEDQVIFKQLEKNLDQRLLIDNLPDTCMPDWPTRCNILLHLLLSDEVREVVLNGSLGCIDHEIVEFSILKRMRAEGRRVLILHILKVDFSLFRRLVGEILWNAALVTNKADSFVISRPATLLPLKNCRDWGNADGCMKSNVSIFNGLHLMVHIHLEANFNSVQGPYTGAFRTAVETDQLPATIQTGNWELE